MTLACVSTAKGAAAIAVVEVFGDSAVEIVQSVFQPHSKLSSMETGSIYTGSIVGGGEIIDHVVVARTEEESIEINCHGNPLIVEMVMELLCKAGAQPVDIERFTAEKLSKTSGRNSIEIEAEIEKLKSRSLQGVNAICKSDLAAVAANWLDRTDSLHIKEIQEKCREILSASESASYFIKGCKAVIAGPPNSGKSTLLNYLCGREKAIVTDIAGTTRDWVSGTCKAGGIFVEFFDTAGLDASIIKNNQIDAESQRRSLELLNQSDIVLLVMDSSKTTENYNLDLVTGSGKKVITVFNKSDLVETAAVNHGISISAKTGDRIDRLLESINEKLVGEGEIQKTLCFTERQAAILKQITQTEDKNSLKDLLSELLSGDIL